MAKATEFVAIFKRRKFLLYETKKILEVNQAVTQGFDASGRIEQARTPLESITITIGSESSSVVVLGGVCLVADIVTCMAEV